jgi:RNA polymerase sigma-70 factor (ECF subfamily)
MNSHDRVDEFMREFTAHESRIYAYIHSLVPHRPDADDLAQETHTVLWKKFGEFQAGSNFFAWACQIARHKVMHYRRSAARNRQVVGLEAAEAIAAQMEQMGEELADRQAAFLDCVKELPPQTARLMHDHYEDGLTADAIAQKRGGTVQAIYKALSRMRQALADCIARKLRPGVGP